jgi:hypothetical protein
MRFICRAKFTCQLAGIVFAVSGASAQTFTSGSTGSDGALNFTTPGTYVFNPKSYTPPLNPAGDNIFNFTTVNIAAGVTVQLTGSIFNSPIVWLAQGAVTINGTLDLSGQNGFSAANTTQRTYTVPGAGGYPGGYPGIGSNPASAGLGPLGGATPIPGCNPDGFGFVGANGGFSGNQFLVPLIGGSGGGAFGSYAGGAGGGAILIASSVSISGAGSIKAIGGASAPSPQGISGSGAGGGIRLVAPTINISGNLNTSGGTAGLCTGTSAGIVRVEAFTIGSINASGNLYTATPFGLFLPTSGVPAISVTTIGGVAVPQNPTGTFTVPDVTVNSASPLPVVIQASNVPVGTVATLTFFSENGPDLTVQSTPLTGSASSSTATATVTLPSGFSKGFVKVNYTQ